MSSDTEAGTRAAVRRDTFYLVAAQALALPLSVIANVLVARTLGPTTFGQLYLTTTLATFGLLFIEAGQSSALAGLAAAHPARAAELLGSALLWRAIAWLPVCGVLLLGARIAGYPREVLWALALLLLAYALTTISNAGCDVLRGRGRTDLVAITAVAWKLLAVAVTVPVLLLWPRLNAVLLAQAACAGIGAVVTLNLLRPVCAGRPVARRATMRELTVQGWPFLLLSLVLALQENVDAAWLARLASSDSVGWYAVARRLTGLLAYPASALTVSLYPVLSRLLQQDPQRVAGAVADALRTTALVAVPAALGCLLFPQLGIFFFDSARFAPASLDLRLLAPYLLLMYLSMPLGSLLMAAGRRTAWVLLQLASVGLSAVLDPWLIRLCQARWGNGGLGVCVSLVVSELLIVAGALWLAPVRVWHRGLTRSAAIPAAGGAAMVAVALALGSFNAWLVAPLALASYVAVLVAWGGLRWAALKRMLGR